MQYRPSLPSRRVSAVALLLTVPGLSPAAEEEQAQTVQADSDEPVEEVVVTGELLESREGAGVGTRLVTPLEEQPLPIQILGREVIEGVNAARLDEAVDFSVGSATANTFGGSTEAFRFRGFDAAVADDGVVINNTIAEGIRRRDSANIARVEVLRGPGAALFGQSSPGGVVNVVTKRPTGEAFFDATIQASSLVRTRGEFDLNLPLTADGAVRARLVTAIEGGNSFRFQDAFDDTFPEDRQFIAPSFAFELGADTELLLRGEYLRNATVFDRGLPIDAAGTPLAERDEFFGDPTAGTTESEDLSAQAELVHRLGSDWTASFLASIDTNEFDGRTVEPEFLAPFNLPANFFAPGSNPRLVAGDTILRQEEIRDRSTDIATLRGDLNGRFQTGPLTHNITASVEYSQLYEDNRVRQAGLFDLGDFNTISLSDPELSQPGPRDFESQFFLDTEIDTVGLIFFDQIDLGERIHILGGGRVDIVDQEVAQLIGQASARSDDETEFSPRVGAVVEPFADERLSLFFSWSESFEVNLAADLAGSLIAPQDGRVFEGGLRYALIEDGLNFSVTAYDIEVENIPLTGFLGITANPATQTSEGVEITLEGDVTDWLSVRANYAYTDSEFTEGPQPSIGEPPSGVPEHAANFLIGTDWSEFGLDGFSSRIAAIYQDERSNARPTTFPNPIDPANPFILGGQELDSFVRLDIYGSYEISERYTIDAGVKNLTDESILMPSSFQFALPQPGVNGFLRLSARF